MIRRHRHLLTAVAGALAATVSTVAPAAAQGAFGLGGSIGANLPRGDYADATATGIVLDGFLGFRVGGAATLRAELFWSRSDIENPLITELGGVELPSGEFADVSGDVDLVGGLATLQLGLGSGPIQPYVLGGAGVYRRRISQDLDGTIDEFQSLTRNDTEIGYNGGAGIAFRLGGVRLFAEGRYHSVQTKPRKTNFIPITVGVAF